MSVILVMAALLPGRAWGSEAAASGSQTVQDGSLAISLPYYSLAIPEGLLGNYQLSYADGPLPSALEEGGSHAVWADDSFRGYLQAQLAPNETHGLSVIFDHTPGDHSVADFEVFCYAGEASSGTDGLAVWADAGALSADGLRVGVRVRVAEASGDGTASELRSRLDDALARAAEYVSWVGGALEGEGDVGLSLDMDAGAPGGVGARLVTPYYEFDLLADVTQHGVGFTYDENGTKPEEGAQRRWGYTSHIMEAAYGVSGADGDWADSITVHCRTEQRYPGEGDSPWFFAIVEGATTSADGLLVEVGVPADIYNVRDQDADALIQSAYERADAVATTVEVK